MNRLPVAIILAATLSIAIATAGTTAQVSAQIPMPVHMQMSASASGCDNSPGPVITLQGELALAGLGVLLTFQNNMKGTHMHTEESTATAIVMPAGESIQLPKQPVQGGAAGNPFIWIQFMSSGGAGLTSEVYLGRCVQGLKGVSADFVIPSLATAQVQHESCDNKGSTIKLSGELSLTGIDAKLIFRNNDNPVGGPHQHDEQAEVTITIIPEGETIEFAKQPPLGGVGGNPWIFLNFLNGDGTTASEQLLLGRCNEL